MRHPAGFAYEFSLKFHIVVSRSTTKLNTYTTHQYVSVITVPQYQLLNPHIRLPGLCQVLDRRNFEDLHLKVIRSVRLSNLLSRFTSLTMCCLVKKCLVFIPFFCCSFSTLINENLLGTFWIFHVNARNSRCSSPLLPPPPPPMAPPVAFYLPRNWVRKNSQCRGICVRRCCVLKK